MKRITWFFSVMICLVGLSGKVIAQTPLYSLTFTNITDVPTGSDHFVTLNLRWNGTASAIPGVPNPLFGTPPIGGNYGVQGAGVAIRVYNGVGAGPGSVTVSAVPANGTDVALGAGFSASTLNILDTAYLDLIAQVPNFGINLLGAAFGTGSGAGVSAPISSTTYDLPLVSFRITGAALGSLTIQANLDDLDSSPSNFTYGSPASGQAFADLITPGTATFNVISAVPEPTTWALIILSIASGIAGLVYYKRHYMQSAEKQLALAQEGEVESE